MGLQIAVTIVDATKVNRALVKLGDSLRERIDTFLKREGAQMEREMKNELAVSARVGRGPRGGWIIVPSAPGDPPAKRTGNLQASVGHRVDTKRFGSSAGSEWSLEVGSLNGGAEVKYAGMLELGTSKMAPRPWLMPVVLVHLDQWPEGLKAEVGYSR